MRSLKARALIAAAVLLASVGGVIAADVGPDAPRRLGIREKVLGVSTWDTLVVSEYNGFSIAWSSPPALIIVEGMGIGENTAWGAAGRDSMTAAVLTTLNAEGWDFSAWDVDTLIVGAGAAGCTFTVTFEDW